MIEINQSFDKEIYYKLPEDYHKYIWAYGWGVICKTLFVYNPFIESPFFNLFIQTSVMRDSYNYLKDKHGIMGNNEGYPFTFYPEHDGLLPFGRTDFGYELYWQTHSNEKWNIVVYPSSSVYLIYDMTMTEFLYKILTQQIYCDGLSNITKNGIGFISKSK